MIKLSHSGFSAYTDSLVYNQYETAIVFLSLVGNRSNLKAISAVLKNQYSIKIEDKENSRPRYLSLDRNYDYNSAIKHVDPVSMLDHVIFYPTCADIQYIDNTMKEIIVLFRKGDSKVNKVKTLFTHIDKAINVPISHTWNDYLLEQFTAEGILTTLPVYGNVAQAAKVELWQDKIIEIISNGLKSKKIT